MVYILLGIVPALVVLLLILNLPQKKAAETETSWRQFHSLGKAMGFSFREISLLKTVALQSEKPDPASLFQSPELTDFCIRFLVRSTRASGNNSPAKQDFIARLYEYRKKIEAEGPGQGLTSSREIEADQNLRVVINNAAVYQSKVIKNTYSYLLATRPVNPKSRAAVSWMGQKIAVYFWKEEDAGYVFDGEVLDEVFFKGNAAIKISQSDSLLRTQKRRAPRAKTHKSTYLYLLTDEAPSNKLETKPGLRCFVEDLSETGCAVTIGGRVHPGIRVKLQFELGGKPFGMSGVVRSVDYNEETRRSLLHIEADPLSQEAKHAIFGEMFSVLPSK
ncbi:MAG: PilZ domain-containing protein [Treponema sp.]|jgi:c-di-GMP-binding flagellar brake protein YcgR|nr:PilZ domain-containing protein [Treponema sp.]